MKQEESVIRNMKGRILCFGDKSNLWCRDTIRKTSKSLGYKVKEYPNLVKVLK